MYITTAIVSALGLATTAMGAAVDVKARSDYQFSCGCESQSDANLDDCKAAIDQIDTDAETMDPMNGIDVVHQGPLTATTVMYQVGNCALGLADQQNIVGPGGQGGGLSGAVISGQDFKDLMTDMVDGCNDGEVVNACASVGGGNAVVFAN